MEQQYLDVLQTLLPGGDNPLGRRVVENMDRTGTGTRRFFGHQMRFDLTKGFPLLTTKKVAFKPLVAELLWFLNASTAISELNKMGAHIWDQWAVSLDTVMQVHRARIEDWMVADTLAYLERKVLFIVPEDNQKDKERPKGWKVVTATDGENTWREWRHPDYDREGCLKLFDLGGIPRHALDRVGDLGPIYGFQWRRWKVGVDVGTLLDMLEENQGAPHQLDRDLRNHLHQHIGADDEVDQIAVLINDIKERPYSRRHIVSARNCADLPDETISPDVNAYHGKQSLPPCHVLFQFYVEPIMLEERVELAVEEGLKDAEHVFYHYKDLSDDHATMDQVYSYLIEMLDDHRVIDKRLSCQIYIRSNDMFIGSPFNIASYALLTHLIAREVGMGVGDLVYTTGDTHLYSNHFEQAREQLTRETMDPPTLRINPSVNSIFDLKVEDIRVENYDPWPTIKAPVAK